MCSLIAVEVCIEG